MKFALLESVLTHYSIEGPDAAPSLVFINSLGLDLRMWDDVASKLSSSFRIVRYDSRGHGLSDCPPAPYSLDEFAGDLHSLLHHLGLKRTALIGISIGGQIAMQFAIRYPDLVSHLVLFDTAARIGSAQGWEERIREVRNKGLEGMTSVILPIWFSSAFIEQQPAIYDGYRNSLIRTPLEGYIGACAALRDADLTQQVSGINATTLIAAGDQDSSTTLDQGRGLAQAIPNARFELVEDAGHLATVEQPELAANMIRKFLGE